MEFSTSKLPFVVQPRNKPVLETLGTEESGQIQIERRGYLTAGERSFHQSNVSQDETMKIMLRAARSVGEKRGLGMKEAYEVLQKALNSGDDSLWIEFNDEINDLMAELNKTRATEDVVKAYCMLLFRVSGDLEVEDILGLHPDLIMALVGLFNDEEARSTEKLNKEFGVEESDKEADILEAEKK